MQGDIPFVHVEADTIPEVFENLMRSVWENGVRVQTEYDKPEEPESRDASAVAVIRTPYGQPRFHRCFADGLGGLAEYVQEVIHGAHDYWVKPVEEIRKGDESTDTRWTYTYHQRLFEYGIEGNAIDQIGSMIDKLAQAPYSRRAQAITWNPLLDPPTNDPPCLQRVWGRLIENADGSYTFNMNTHWRSRDLYKAWFENVIALTTLQRKIAQAISSRLNKPVQVGRYVDMVDSLHIYGAYFHEIEDENREGVKGFFDMIAARSFTDRTWTSDFVKPFFIDDGLNKGLKRMLEREKDMPELVRSRIQAELEEMQDSAYIV